MPAVNCAVSSFDFQKANVTGTVTMTLHMENADPIAADSGLLVGEIVKGPLPLLSRGPAARSYLVRCAVWRVDPKNKQMTPPPDAGEVDFEITGNAAQGYTLIGSVLSSQACGNFSQLDAAVGEMTGHFSRSVPAQWAARVVLQKQ